MHIVGDGNLVVQPPAPRALRAQKVVDHPLNDLAIRPEIAAHGILKLLVPLRPRVTLNDRLGRLQELAASSQSRGNFRTQLFGKRGDHLLDADLAAVHRLGPKQFGELLENLPAYHVRFLMQPLAKDGKRQLHSERRAPAYSE
jgi:hypothetical protein